MQRARLFFQNQINVKTPSLQREDLLMGEKPEREETSEQMVKPFLSNIPLAAHISTDVLVSEPVPEFVAPQPVSKVSVSIPTVESDTNSNSPVTVSLVTKTLATSLQQEQLCQSPHQSCENGENGSLPFVTEELSLSTEVKQTLQQLEQERLNRERHISRESQLKQVSAISLPNDLMHHRMFATNDYPGCFGG